MRELEFLPQWYPQLRTRKRQLVLQAWLTLAVIAGLCLALSSLNHSVRGAHRALAQISGEASATEAQVKKLDELLGLQKQLARQERVMARLGVGVETTRLLNTLEGIMPREMAILNLGMETHEQARPVANLTQALNTRDKDAAVVRQLRVRLAGVVPTDADLASFLASLSGAPLFKQVTMNYARERADNGHVMREFEVSFVVPLSGD